jgi:hypothetical protein
VIKVDAGEFLEPVEITMEYIIFAACNCIGQACCWYRIFSCLGCIDDGTAHVRIEKQIVVMVPVVPTVDPNPFKAQIVPEVNPFTGRAKT